MGREHTHTHTISILELRKTNSIICHNLKQSYCSGMTATLTVHTRGPRASPHVDRSDTHGLTLEGLFRGNGLASFAFAKLFSCLV